MATVTGTASNPNEAGVIGESQEGEGVHGVGHSPGAGVAGYNDNPEGGVGVWGQTNKGLGVHGESKDGEGVRGVSHSQGAGVAGYNDNPEGGPGVWGHTQKGNGVHGESDSGEGVRGLSHSPGAGVAGYTDNPEGIGIFGKGGRLAGLFEGDVEVTGDIRLANADCAEDFDIADAASVEPGTVMVLGDDEGALHQSHQPYDRRVAGVISGAGDYKPGIVLDKQQSSHNRQPVALLGKVYCKVDAQYGAVEVGDLLTTSASPGHAMKADEPLKAFGAVIGKALRPLKEGQGLIPILIALQ